MELWDTYRGSGVLLEVLLGEGYEQELRDLAYAAEAVDARGAMRTDVGNVASCAPGADFETVPDAERELLLIQHRFALRLGQAISRVLDTQIAEMILKASAECGTS